MTKYEQLLDRFLERSGISWSKRDELLDYASSLAIEFSYDIEERLKKHEDEMHSATTLVAGLFITQIGVDKCLESWGLQDPSADTLTEEDRLRLAKYVLIQNFKNLRNSLLKRKTNEV